MQSDVRYQSVSRESVENYRDNIHGPALKMVKDQKSTLLCFKPVPYSRSNRPECLVDEPCLLL